MNTGNTGRHCGGGRLVLSQAGLAAPTLYYALSDDGRGLAWSQDPADILAWPEMSRSIDCTALVSEHVFGFPIDGRTPFSAMRRVPCGGTITVTPGHDGRLDVSVSAPGLSVLGGGHPGDSLPDRLQDAVCRTVYDGAGILLSGGIDSTLLAAYAVRAARRRGCELFALTAAGDGDAAAADTAAAQQVAGYLGLPLLKVEVTAGDPLTQWATTIGRTMSVRPPSGTIAAVAPAARNVPVLVCGEGADELFAGYWWVYPHPRLYAAGLGRRLAGLGREVPGGKTVRALIDRYHELSEDDLFTALYELNITDRMPALQLAHARAEAFPIPVAFPYADARVAACALALPASRLVSAGLTKRPLRDLVSAELPGLGADIAARHKSTLPDSAAGLRAAVTATLDQLPETRWASHPLRWLCRSRLELLTADLFGYIWYVHGGRPPQDVDWSRLYRELDPVQLWGQAAPELAAHPQEVTA